MDLRLLNELEKKVGMLFIKKETADTLNALTMTPPQKTLGVKLSKAVDTFSLYKSLEMAEKFQKSCNSFKTIQFSFLYNWTYQCNSNLHTWIMATS